MSHSLYHYDESFEDIDIDQLQLLLTNPGDSRTIPLRKILKPVYNIHDIRDDPLILITNHEGIEVKNYLRRHYNIKVLILMDYTIDTILNYASSIEQLYLIRTNKFSIDETYIQMNNLKVLGYIPLQTTIDDSGEIIDLNRTITLYNYFDLINVDGIEFRIRNLDMLSSIKIYTELLIEPGRDNISVNLNNFNGLRSLELPYNIARYMLRADRFTPAIERLSRLKLTLPPRDIYDINRVSSDVITFKDSTIYSTMIAEVNSSINDYNLEILHVHSSDLDNYIICGLGNLMLTELYVTIDRWMSDEVGSCEEWPVPPALKKFSLKNYTMEDIDKIIESYNYIEELELLNPVNPSRVNITIDGLHKLTIDCGGCDIPDISSIYRLEDLSIMNANTVDCCNDVIMNHNQIQLNSLKNLYLYNYTKDTLRRIREEYGHSFESLTLLSYLGSTSISFIPDEYNSSMNDLTIDMIGIDSIDLHKFPNLSHLNQINVDIRDVKRHLQLDYQPIEHIFTNVRGAYDCDTIMEVITDTDVRDNRSLLYGLINKLRGIAMDV